MAVFLRLQYYLVHQNRLTSVHDYYILYVQVRNNGEQFDEILRSNRRYVGNYKGVW